MENINVKIEILSCVYDELNEQDKALVDLAKQATANSYSPYSHFRVGAAIRSVSYTHLTLPTILLV